MGTVSNLLYLLLSSGPSRLVYRTCPLSILGLNYHVFFFAFDAHILQVIIDCSVMWCLIWVYRYMFTKVPFNEASILFEWVKPENVLLSRVAGNNLFAQVPF